MRPNGTVRRRLISLFIAWNAAVILFTNSQYFLLPSEVVRVLQPYGRATRLLQRWALFCPEPRRYTGQYSFHAIFKDGSHADWSRPMPPNWGFFARHHAYNWQKYDSASNHMEDRSLWPDLAAWASRLFWNDANPPETIELIHQFALTPPPLETGDAWPDPAAFSYKSFRIFDYSVSRKEFLR